MTTFYFTSTGNSLSVAKRIGGNLVSIPQVIDDPTTLYKDDVIGVVFSVYSNAPPKMVREFIDKVKLEADYTLAIGTYGNIPGACMYNLQKKAIENGYRFDYVNQILMVDNFLPVFEMDAEIAKLPKKNVDESTTKIISDIQSCKHMQAKAGVAARMLACVLSGMKTDKNALGYIVNSTYNLCMRHMRQGMPGKECSRGG